MAVTFDNSFQRDLAVQSWTMYGIGMFAIAVRAYARWRRVGGLTQFAFDDWIMVTAVPAFYTILIVCLNVIAGGGGSNLFPPEQFATFTPEDIEERIKGSKIVIVSEQAMLNVIWALKACMLFMFARMAAGTKYLRYIHWLAIYVAVGWCAVEIAFFTACRPFSGYWAVPPPNPQCTTLEHYAQVQAVFNISSDVCMLLIPLPMIISLSLPLKQRIVLSVVFSMGSFVIIAAILTKVYNLSDVYSTVYMLWYTREASVAVYVANLPAIWPLLREHIKFLRTVSASGRTGHSNPPHYNHSGSRFGNLSNSNGARIISHPGRSDDDDMELGKSNHFVRSTTRSIPSSEKSLGSSSGSGSGSGSGEDRVGHFSRKMTEKHGRRGSPDSDERALNDMGRGGWNKMNLDIHVDRTIEVNRGSWDGSALDGMHTGTQHKVKISGPDGGIPKSSPKR